MPSPECMVGFAGQDGPAVTEPSDACPGGGEPAPPLDPQACSTAAAMAMSFAARGNDRMNEVYTAVGELNTSQSPPALSEERAGSAGFPS